MDRHNQIQQITKSTNKPNQPVNKSTNQQNQPVNHK